MDLIVVISNNQKVRKKVKSYLDEIGLGDFLTTNSTGSFRLLSSNDMKIRTIDSMIDNKVDLINRGKIIYVLNDQPDKSIEIIDDITAMLNSGTETYNSGIAFCIEIAKLI